MGLSTLLYDLSLAVFHESSGIYITSYCLYSLIYRLQNYDATCRLAQEIAENIHERNRQQRTGGNPAKVKCYVHKLCGIFYTFVVKWWGLHCCHFGESFHILSFQINMTLRASLQKLKQNIAQLKDGLLRTSSTRRMYPLFCKCSRPWKSWDTDYLLVMEGGHACSNGCCPIEGIRVFYKGLPFTVHVPSRKAPLFMFYLPELMWT